MDRRDFLKGMGLALAAGPYWLRRALVQSSASTSPFVEARIPERGMYSLQPAARWEEALVAGNGTLGILVYGDPLNERIIFNHELLYEPLRDERVPPPDLAPYLPRIRALMLEGRYREAVEYSLEMAHREGWPGLLWTDPYHPAFASCWKCDGDAHRVPAPHGLRHRRDRCLLAYGDRHLHATGLRLAHRRRRCAGDGDRGRTAPGPDAAPGGAGRASARAARGLPPARNHGCARLAELPLRLRAHAPRLRSS
ncbi:glycoside hydrolase N-terminal domain-containing protein, partial [Rhodothermus marinus]|uniref:glycoside hydrolase N-terminal domain-containing protein n=1 Tax=Rhodothermus marinus TaxID=29549 RepID=UPI001FB2EE44